MMTADVIKYPLIGIVERNQKVVFAYSAFDESDFYVVPFHTVLKGYTKSIRVIDAAGDEYVASLSKIKGIHWESLRTFGVITSFLVFLFCGLNFPLKVEFSLSKVGYSKIEDVKRSLLTIVNQKPKYYTRRSSINTVLKRINSAKSIDELSKAISNSG